MFDPGGTRVVFQSNLERIHTALHQESLIEEYVACL